MLLFRQTSFECEPSDLELSALPTWPPQPVLLISIVWLIIWKLFRKLYMDGAPVAEMIRASPLFRHTHYVEAGVVSSIPLAAGWSCPGCICVSIPAIFPGRCMSLSCAVKFPMAILYGVVVICNFRRRFISRLLCQAYKSDCMLNKYQNTKYELPDCCLWASP